MKSYVALGFGENFFYQLGSETLPIPSTLFAPNENGNGDASHEHPKNDNNNNNSYQLQVSLLPLHSQRACQNTCVDAIPCREELESSLSPRNWLCSKVRSCPTLPSRTLPLVSCGVTHTSFVVPAEEEEESKRIPTKDAIRGEAHILGTIFGHTYPQLTIQPTRLPLKIVRISSGRRHVIALTEGSVANDSSSSNSFFNFGSSGSGGSKARGGLVLTWGAGHFGQLGHGSECTSCLEPRIVERLTPHMVGGYVIEIAAGGLHSAAIVAYSMGKNHTVISSSVTDGADGTSSDSNIDCADSIVLRETKTFAWGSNRKSQCGIEGGKCATIPSPLPVVTVKRSDGSSRKDSSTLDKEVYFETISLGRLHSVALTAYGEVFSWGSTSMGRCGHGSVDTGRGGDRRICPEPRFVSALKNVVIDLIAAGDAHTLALSRNGRVFAWGAGTDGQCGQGHAGNLFAPKPIPEIHFATASLTDATNIHHLQEGETNSLSNVPKTEIGMDDITINYEKESDDLYIPRVNSKVAMEVTVAEEALTKALSIKKTVNLPNNLGKRYDEMASNNAQSKPKIVGIRASGCYSAAISLQGDVYSWGYGGGSALGHPVPSKGKILPQLPISEGNQYSYATAAKIFPEGGTENNVIRDCCSFDTNLNVMLPRRIDCIQQLGLHVEDVALGPGHMVLLCSMISETENDRIENDWKRSQSLSDTAEYSQHNIDDHVRAPHESSDGLSSMKVFGATSDTHSKTQETINVSITSTIGSVRSDTTSTSAEITDNVKSGGWRSATGGWRAKKKSSRSNKDISTASETKVQVAGKEKKSFLPLDKLLDVTFPWSGGKS